MMKEKKKLLIFSLLFFIVCFCLLPIIQSFLKLEVLYLGHGRLAIFFNQWSDVDSCGREFQIRDSFGRIINAGCFVEFCDEPENTKNEVISTKGENLVGILDHQLYPPVFVICDFSAGICSPCDTTKVEEKVLMDRLKEVYPDLP